MSRSMLPPLNALRAFEATARLGGVGRAAQDLHVTHGAVSRQLKLLEDHLGLALFQRAGRGLRLTAAGTRLQAACSEAFSGIEDCVRETEEQRLLGIEVICRPTWEDIQQAHNEAGSQTSAG